MRNILYQQERLQTHWNADPYAIGQMGSGTTEFAPAEWLLPYWLMKYYKAIN